MLMCDSEETRNFLNLDTKIKCFPGKNLVKLRGKSGYITGSPTGPYVLGVDSDTRAIYTS